MSDIDTIHTRLKKIRKYFKLSIRDFSKEIHHSHSVYHQFEHGDRKPNSRMIELIVSKFNVSRDYILTGKGAMFNTDAPPDTRLNRILEIYNEVSDPFKEMILQMSRIILEHHRKDG